LADGFRLGQHRFQAGVGYYLYGDHPSVGLAAGAYFGRLVSGSDLHPYRRGLPRGVAKRKKATTGFPTGVFTARRIGSHPEKTAAITETRPLQRQRRGVSLSGLTLVPGTL